MTVNAEADTATPVTAAATAQSDAAADASIASCAGTQNQHQRSDSQEAGDVPSDSFHIGSLAAMVADH
jgi:hypothetical protein